MFLLLGGLLSPLAADVLALQQRVIEVFEANRNAVVRVKAAFRTEGEEEGRALVTLKVGTGFFISKEGHVLVNSSRAAGADRVWVEFRGKPYVAEPVGHDRLTNVSVLRVVSPPDDFTFIPVDSGTAKPQLGAIVIGISCPLDFDPSPSMGLVSGMENKIGAQVFPTEYIRTSIAVDSGQGGCPILDINGRLLGMTVASIPDMDSSYAMPVEALIRVRDDILFSGHMIHSWMGFRVAEATDPDGESAVYLSSIVENAPAETAGLKEGDVLLSIGGREIANVADVPSAVFFTRANQYTMVKVRRGDEVFEVSVKTLPRPEKDPLIAPQPAAADAGAKTGPESGS